MKVQKILEVNVPGLGERIKKIRKLDQRSLVELCSAAGMTISNWYYIEKGKREVLPEPTLRRIEAALNADFGIYFEDSHNG